MVRSVARKSLLKRIDTIIATRRVVQGKGLEGMKMEI